MAIASTEFKRLRDAYGLLRRTRVKSDYRFEASVGQMEAQSALEDARWVVSRLRHIDDKSFRAFPIRPLRMR